VDTGPAKAFADLHCHSSASFDSLSRPADLVRAAIRRGLTHLAITDHERLDGALRARDLAGDSLTVIVGEEVRTTGGDLIGLYLERPIPPGLDPQDAAAAIRAQGGLVGLPHPFDRFRSSGGARAMHEAAVLADLAGLADYVEVHNGRAIRGNAAAAEFAARHGLRGTAASDAHTVLEVGVAYAALASHPRTADEMRDALDGARLVTGRGSYLVRTWTPVAKAVQWMRGNRRVAVPGPPGAARIASR
jgi:predicted metal-dependent phosphoesterase TrpH